PKDAVMDDGPADAKAPGVHSIHGAMPERIAPRVEFVRVLEPQEALCMAVTFLLLEIGPDGLTPMMPDHRRRRKADLITGFLQTPAEVHIIACCPIFRVDPFDLLERRFKKGHVAAGNMLGDLIGDQHMSRLARRYRDPGGERTVVRRQIRAADTCRAGLLE